MKFTRLFFQITALVLTVGAVACCMIAYWDRIVYFFDSVGYRLRKIRHGKTCDCCAEVDDFADFEV